MKVLTIKPKMSKIFLERNVLLCFGVKLNLFSVFRFFFEKSGEKSSSEEKKCKILKKSCFLENESQMGFLGEIAIQNH